MINVGIFCVEILRGKILEIKNLKMWNFFIRFLVFFNWKLQFFMGKFYNFNLKLYFHSFHFRMLNWLIIFIVTFPTKKLKTICSQRPPKQSGQKFPTKNKFELYKIKRQANPTRVRYRFSPRSRFNLTAEPSLLAQAHQPMYHHPYHRHKLP